MKRKVAILGGGVAGLSAALELIERGFEVHVYEARHIAGGKARSIHVYETPNEANGAQGLTHPPSLASPTRQWLPGEHGFRFFPAFYKHVVDTMARVPSYDGRSVADHLVPTTRILLTQYDNSPFQMPSRFPRTPGDFRAVLSGIVSFLGPTVDIDAEELTFFISRVWQILTSCRERRLNEYEQLGWWSYIGAEQRSTAYKRFLGHGITRSLVAAKAEKASTKTIGDILVQLLLSLVEPTETTADRLLDGPTNSVWITPMREYLQALGVNFHFDCAVTRILTDGNDITGVSTKRRNGSLTTIEADWYICALPVDVIAKLITPELTTLDPALANIVPLAENVDWMNGIQYYLRRDVPMVHGHAIHIDSEWALTSVSQAQFWPAPPLNSYGDGMVNGVLSVDISDWEAVGTNGKRARDCTRSEVAEETWHQLKRSVNRPGAEVLRDEDLHYWFLDPDIRLDPDNRSRLKNSEPLLVNLVNTWRLRPDAVTKIPNLFLASDYVRTYTDLATMEGANEAARRAVNGILDAAGSDAPACQLWPLREPEVLAPLRAYDAGRYSQGLPWDSTSTRIVDSAAQQFRGPLTLSYRLGDKLVEGQRPGTSPLIVGIERGGDDSASPMPRTEFDDFPGLVSWAMSLDDWAPKQLANHLPTGEPHAQIPGAGHGSLIEAPHQLLHSPVIASASASPPETAPIAREGPNDFRERLTWYRDETRPVLDAVVPTGAHNRWLYGPITEALQAPGKGMRPALLLANCGAHGGNREGALPSAAGIELLHQAFLVHDDIEDQSEHRHGRPTMHRAHGVPIAVNAGDAMNALAMRLFRSNVDTLGPQSALRIFDEVDHLLVETLEGQAMDLGWIHNTDGDFTDDGYLDTVRKKTCWYSTIHPLRIGALIANPQDDALERFDHLGYLMGAAFQIRDDVLNLAGNRQQYGKEIGGDLYEGKRTLMLTHTLREATPDDRRTVLDFLGRSRNRRLPREVVRIRSLIDRYGGIEHARQIAADLAAQAEAEFIRVYADVPASPDRSFLEQSVAWMTGRSD